MDRGSLVFAIVVVGAALLAAWAGTGAVWRVLHRRGILAHPNHRSSHSTPTPTGGGIAVTGTVVAAWTVLAAGTGTLGLEAGAVALGALVLALASWLDDLRPLPAALRLLVHCAVAAATLGAMLESGRIPAGGAESPLALGAIVLAWAWFINVYNFMDGIDGLAGVESLAIGLGAALVAALADLPAPLGADGLVVAAAALGVLAWNWQPARIFLGDVGSVPLGFLLGWLMLRLALAGHGVEALILCLYYLSDATLTFFLRIVRGEKFLEAHRQHFYQKAARRLGRHALVAGWVLAADAVLIGLAGLAALGWRWPALAGACLVVAGLLRFMAGGRARAPEEASQP
jgi:UDP-N-acetylmuramyl pentapeptide phosphotransferase/UDP-N-acetylglucosamine-1-phosphate transferase